MAINPKQLGEQIVSSTPKLKPRDDAFTQKMNEFHTKRKALLDSNKYLEPEWDALVDEMDAFRSGYEKPKLYSAREYLLDTDPNEFQIDKVRDDIDFKGLWDEMQKGADFYKIASVDGEGFDSDVREKLFNGMSDRLGLDYDDIYYKWLGRSKPTQTPTVGGKTFDNGNNHPTLQPNQDYKKVLEEQGMKDFIKELYGDEIFNKMYGGK